MDFALTLDSTAEQPLYQQLYDQLRQAILTGRLRPGQKLPSSRDMARLLDVARLTVLESYDRLLSEGYLTARHGAGTFVAEGLPSLTEAPTDVTPDPPVRLSAFGRGLVAGGALWRDPAQLQISFGYGRPALHQFPHAVWRQLLARQGRDNPELLDYSTDVQGYRPLREAIADYLATSRGIVCDADEIVIVNGSQQGFDLTTRLLLDAGDLAAIEEPGYLGARRTIVAHGAGVVPVRVDEAGVVPSELPANPDIRLLYLTPSHQFPTGATLPLARRLAVLAWAQQHRAIIVEDDYDSEYRYGEKPVPALKGLDRHGSVIYLGTFSKVMFPALRIGYVVLPRHLVTVFGRAKWLADRQSPMLDQAALADFIREGHLARTIRKNRALYRRRRQALIEALADHFGDAAIVLGDNAGMHVMIRLKTALSDAEVLERAAAAGVEFASTRQNYLGEPPGGEFVLGYAALDEAVIAEGIRRLAQAMRTA